MIKFKDSFFDKINGTSTVWITEGKKEYKGSARLHPEDEKYKSEFRGCRIAETRAIIKALKDRRKKLENEYKICKNFVNDICSYKVFESDSKMAKAIFKQLNIRKRKLEAVKSAIKQAQYDIKTSDKALEIMKNKKNNESKED